MKFMSRIVERNETVMEKIVNTEEKLCQKWMFRNLLEYEILRVIRRQAELDAVRSTVLYVLVLKYSEYGALYNIYPGLLGSRIISAVIFSLSGILSVFSLTLFSMTAVQIYMHTSLRYKYSSGGIQYNMMYDAMYGYLG